MKIWFLTSENLGFESGGIATYTANMGRILAAAGHDVVWISRGANNRESKIAERFILSEFRSQEEIAIQETAGPANKHPGFPYNVVAFWSAFSWQLSEHLLSVGRKHGWPDVIESQDYMGIPYFLLQNRLLQRNELAKAPVIVHLHSPDFLISRYNRTPAYRLPYYWYHQMERDCLQMADSVLAPSAFIKREAIRDTGLGSTDITHIPYPFPCETGLPHPEDSTKSALAYFGRIERRKGIEPLLESVDRLWRKGVDFTLTCYGSDMPWGADAPSGMALFSERYQEHVAAGRLVFSGKIAPDQVLRAMEKASICVIPSLWENFPHTCLEAMANRRIVIASQSGGQSEMLGDTGTCGYVHDPDKPESLDQCIQEALGLSPLKRKQIGSEAHLRISQLCGPEIILEKRLEHMESLIQPTHGKKFFFGDPGKQEACSDGPNKVTGTLAVIRESDGPESMKAAIQQLQGWKVRDLSYVLLTSKATAAEIRDSFPDLEFDVENLERLATNQAANRRMRKRFEENHQVLFMLYPCLVQKAFLSLGKKCFKRHGNVHFTHPWILGFPDRLQIWPASNTHSSIHKLSRQCGPLVLCRASAMGQVWKELLTALNSSGLPDFGSIAYDKGLRGVAIPEVLGEGLYFPKNQDFSPPVQRRIGGQEAGSLEGDSQLDVVQLLEANGPSQFWSHPAIWFVPLQNHLSRLEDGAKELAERLEELGEREKHLADGLRWQKEKTTEYWEQAQQLKAELAQKVEESEGHVQKLLADLTWQKEKTTEYWKQVGQLESDLAWQRKQADDNWRNWQSSLAALEQTEEALEDKCQESAALATNLEELDAEHEALLGQWNSSGRLFKRFFRVSFEWFKYRLMGMRKESDDREHP